MAENEEDRPRRRPRGGDEQAPARRPKGPPRRRRPESPAEGAGPRRRRFALDDEELVGPRRVGAPPVERRVAERRQGQRDVLLLALRDLPSFGKLLYRLARDPRVSGLDKALVAAALTYAAIPEDYIPDRVPFLGELDDFVLIALALGRLVNNAGPELLYEHWEGEPETLDSALAMLNRAAGLIPGRLRALLGASE